MSIKIYIIILLLANTKLNELIYELESNTFKFMQ